MVALESRPTTGLWNGLALCVQALYAGLVVGFVVGMFRLAEACVGQWLMPVLGQEKWYDWSMPLWFAAMVPLAWGIGRLVRVMPDISGSGIPQVELTLHEGYPLQWSRLLWAKFLGAWLAIAGGLSLGREGPCIQLGAAVGAGVNALWRAKPSNTMRSLRQGRLRVWGQLSVRRWRGVFLCTKKCVVLCARGT